MVEVVVGVGLVVDVGAVVPSGGAVEVVVVDGETSMVVDGTKWVTTGESIGCSHAPSKTMTDPTTQAPTR